MRWQSLLLGYLAKATRSQGTPEPDDTMVTVPPILQANLELVYPFFSLYSAAQGVLQPVNSFIFSEEVAFNNNNVVDLIALGPGLWDVQAGHFFQASAGVLTNDNTSSSRLDFFAVDGTGSTATLGKVNNSVAVNNYFMESKFRALVTADQPFQFRRTNVIGAGTGTHLVRSRIIATRLF